MAFRSPGRTITDADLVAFAGLTGDYSELHTSDVYARSSQFGRRVAHGMLGLAYAHGLMWARTGELRETAIAFLGISDWKFLGPIFVGDTIFVNYRHRRAARQQVEADAGDRGFRRRGREPGRHDRAARPQGAAGFESAARRRLGIGRAGDTGNGVRHAMTVALETEARSGVPIGISQRVEDRSARTRTSRSSR